MKLKNVEFKARVRKIATDTSQQRYQQKRRCYSVWPWPLCQSAV